MIAGLRELYYVYFCLYDTHNNICINDNIWINYIIIFELIPSIQVYFYNF